MGVTGEIGTIQDSAALNQVTVPREEMSMRIVNPAALASVAARQIRTPRRRRSIRQRVNAYTLWAFNPQRELPGRGDRAA